MPTDAPQDNEATLIESPVEDEQLYRLCKTMPLVDNFSTCLTANLECKYISPFGYSYLCLHPRHREFSKS